jgi:hypothetical protein
VETVIFKFQKSLHSFVTGTRVCQDRFSANSITRSFRKAVRNAKVIANRTIEGQLYQNVMAMRLSWDP